MSKKVNQTKPTSKIIQIEQFKHARSYLTVLCEDGSIWELLKSCIDGKESETWQCIFNQKEVSNAK